MPFRWIGILGFLLVFAGKLRAQGEIVLSVGNDSVGRTEWLHAFRKSPLAYQVVGSGLKNAVVVPKVDLKKEFAARFIEHKLKVCAARDAGIDTLPAFRASWKWAHTRLLKLYMVDVWREEQALRCLYLRGEQRLKNNRWVRVAHITRYLPQQCGSDQEHQARLLMDSLYQAIQCGADFANLARRFSDDYTTASQGGVLPWLPVHKQMQEWIVQLDDLTCNQVSRPFFSPLGIHLVKWLDRKEGLSFEECRSRLEDFRESRASVEYRRLTAKEAESLALEERSLYEGLLVAYAEPFLLGKNKPLSDSQLKHYFEQHRDRYAWSFPHFKGAVISGVDKKLVKRLCKKLKKLPFQQWRDAVCLWHAQHPADTTLQVKIGLFRIGSQPAVDKWIYKCGTFTPDPHRPVVQVVGKNLKKGPEHWEDVREVVISDCRNAQKEALMHVWRKKYKVELHEEVLKTVNIDGNR